MLKVCIASIIFLKNNIQPSIKEKQSISVSSDPLRKRYQDGIKDAKDLFGKIPVKGTEEAGVGEERLQAAMQVLHL